MAAKTTQTKKSTKAAKEEVVVPVAEVKEEVKVEAPAVEEKKPAAKKSTKTTKAAKAVKEEVKEVAAAPVAEVVKEEVKAEAKTEVFVEFNGVQESIDEVIENVKKTFAAEGNTDEIKSVKVYLKPQDSAAYYVVNDTIEGKMDVYF